MVEVRVKVAVDKHRSSRDALSGKSGIPGMHHITPCHTLKTNPPYSIKKTAHENMRDGCLRIELQL